ncbi:MAG: hypothetical protein AAF628_12800 [Planctomycetota bacterium]
MTVLSSPPRPRSGGPPEDAPADLDEARRAFFGLEHEHGLFGRYLGGCRAWDYLRVEVFDALVGALQLRADKQAPQDRSARAYLPAWRSVAHSVLRRNPFAARPTELLFIGHSRRRREDDGRYWDPYSDPAIEALASDALLLERPHHHRHLQPTRTRRIAHLDGLALLANGVSAWRGAPLGADDSAVIARIEEAIADTFGVRVPVGSMARAKLAVRAGQLPCWRTLLRRLRPRLVFVVVSYGNEIPIEACRSLGIPTVELQHGLIGPQNLGYHFPLPDCRKELFCDWLLTFGDYWRTAARFPIPAERVLAVGYPYLDTRRRAAGPRRASARRALFLSQPSIGAPLSRLAVDLANDPRLGGAEVVYKLHPGEIQSWCEDYPWLREAPVRVIDRDRPHLYELFAEASLQIGAYSTALFEGLAFGLQTRVVRLPGSEQLQGMVDAAPQAEFADDADDLMAALELASSLDPADASQFFSPGAAEQLQRAVAHILDVEGR